MLVALAAALVLLRLLGVAWWVVESPSMGRAAPVGTLVVTTAPTGRIVPGDVVTYSPPSGAAGTVTHRVTAVQDGRLTTKGDANASADAWPVPRADVRGRAVAILPGLGWLLRLLPVLAAGVAVVLLASLLVRDRAVRSAVRLIGAAAVVCGVVLALRPLVNAMVTTVVTHGHRVDVQLAGTGLLPVRVSAAGRSADLVSGGFATLQLPPGVQGRILLTTSLHLEPWGWALFAAVCALPTAVAIARLAGRAA